MAESGGQKPIRNTLLSAATGANFFEEAAMLIPVPLIEPESQEPATAEIDLNSDDSSSNRGSVEKEFGDTLTLNETDAVQISEEPAPSISLFSRASVDAFSRMLSGPPRIEPTISQPPIVLPTSSTTVLQSATVPPLSRTRPSVSVKPEPTSPAPSPLSAIVEPEPVSSSSVSQSVQSSASFQAPPAVSPGLVFAPVGIPRDITTQSVVSTTDVSTTSVTPSSVNLFSSGNQADDGPIPSASSIFATGSVSSSSLFSTSNLFSPSHTATFPPAPVATTPSAFVAVTGSGPQTSFYPNSTLPSVSTITSTPLEPVPTPVIQNVPLVTPGTLPSSSAPPPAVGSGNAFRLGSQRMKYVACPEMQPAQTSQVQSPLYRPPDVMSPVTSPPVDQSSFTPSAFPPTPSQPYQTPSPIVSSFSSQDSLSSTSTRSAHPVLNANLQYNQTTLGVSPYGPQELPPLTYHWFYRKDVDGKAVWKPFSIIDSVALEDAYLNDKERLVPTDGGRYDVSVVKRSKMPVYWDEAPIEVRRGSWFFKGPMDNRFIPYDEEFALKLEHEYADCMRTGGWQKRLEFPEGESVIMHSAGVVVHFCQAAAPDDWGNLPESQIRPRVVKRGVEEIEVEDGESSQVDHLVFVVHGIGPICDFKLRNIVEAVDDFRSLSIQLIHSHFRESIDRSLVGRIEFLPVSWHKALHGDKGIDEQLKRITLRSIPKFRDFTNDTLLDILFYTSPVYCQTIIDSVGSELNRIYKLFRTRNPTFQGKVSLTGHSLGSLILFDLLAHQAPTGSHSSVGGGDVDGDIEAKQLISVTQAPSQTDDSTLSTSSSRTVSYTVGNAGTGQPFITYPTIDFQPTAFFALGSPIAMFVTVRGIEQLGNDFRLPTCPAFFNIFHPYDPVAYRIETLIDPNFQSRPVLIPHHKGRKRIHLELKETMARVGADIKHRVIDAVKNTLNTVYHYTGFSKNPENLESEIQSAIAGEMEKKSEADGAEDENAHIRIGSLNGGRRIDHVLQEAPYETFNEYVFAMSTHVGYWESEDTMLLILTEVYGSMGIQRDRQVAGIQQGIVSPTHHPLPSGSVTAAVAMQYPNQYASSFNQQSSNSYSYSGYQPSAPPAAPITEYKSPGQAHPPTPAFFNGSPSVSSTAQNVPMISPTNQSGGVLLPPSPAPVVPSAATSTKPYVIGNRPVADPTFYPRGMDPTAPMLSMSQVGPPPKAGFVPKQN